VKHFVRRVVQQKFFVQCIVQACNMAYRLRTAVVRSLEQIEDSRERLSALTADNNLTDIQQITRIINGLGNSNMSQLEAFILRAETTVSVMEDLLVSLKAEKKRKEALAKVIFLFIYLVTSNASSAVGGTYVTTCICFRICEELKQSITLCT